MKLLTRFYCFCSLLLLSTVSFAFSGGTGTQEDPYLIVDCQGLQSIIGFPSEHFQLANDINCNGFDYGDGGGFMPIGSSNYPFIGTLDGDGYTISYLYINRPQQDRVGLISYLDNGIIKNLALTDSAVVGKGYVGGIVGYAAEGEMLSNISYKGSVTGSYFVGGLVGASLFKNISDSHVDAIVTTTSYGAGGLVGYLHYSNISNSSAAGEVASTSSSGSQLGGLVGTNYATGYNIIEKSFSNTIVRGYHSVGGLVGDATGLNINNNYALGEVYADHYVGGLIGYADGYYTLALTNNYAAALVKGAIYAGGLIGYKTGTVTINNSYWDTVVSTQPFSAGGTPKTTAEMFQQATYVNWNFDTTWMIDEGVNYPHLRETFTDE